MFSVRNLARTVLVMSVLFLLSGCASGPKGEIDGFSLLASGMRSDDCYSFFLHRGEDGACLFSCSVDAEGRRIEFEDRPAPESLLNAFRRAAADTGLEKAVRRSRPALFRFHVADKKSYSVSLTWENGADKTMKSRPPEEDALVTFLTKAAEVLAVTEDEADPLLSLYLSASASWIEGSYSFDFSEDRHQPGTFRLSAVFTQINQEDWSETSIDLEDAPLNPDQVDRIRAAVRESGLWNRFVYSAIRWEWENGADDGEILMPLDATTYYAGASWGDLSLSDSGWGDPDYGPLLPTLKEIALALWNERN